jgi:hypothetical protein
MNKQELIKKIKIKLMESKRHFISKQNEIEEAERLIVMGLEKNEIVNNAYVINGIDILSKYISATSVREAIRLVQDEFRMVKEK